MRLPDINVWLALTFDSHVHHPAAKKWFDGLLNNDAYLAAFAIAAKLELITFDKSFGRYPNLACTVLP